VPPLEVCSGADQQPHKALSKPQRAMVGSNRAREPSGRVRRPELKDTSSRKSVTSWQAATSTVQTDAPQKSMALPAPSKVLSHLLAL
jgi:hypothetical protein